MSVILLVAALTAQANEVRRLPAPEAHQGAVADRKSVYAVDNSSVARYDKKTGRRAALWRGDPARFRHVNSCTVRSRDLVCAASNYPDTPMTSQVLWLDRRSMVLEKVRDLGAGHGSLTWLDWHDGSWWAGFANYDGKGGEPGRDHRATVVVRYGRDFVERRAFRFPAAILDRFAPRSSSGGAWGRDGLLYVTGHDRPELYVFRLPRTGDELDLVATIATPTGGQAIGWDRRDRRVLWTIARETSELVASRVPVVRLNNAAGQR